MIFAQPGLIDGGLFSIVVVRFQDLLQEPLVAAGSAEYTAHQMPAAVGVGECVERIIGINAEFLRRYENRSGGTQTDVAAALTNGPRSHSRCRIVSGSRTDLDRFGKAQLFCHIRGNCSNAGIAFKQCGHLCLR